MPQRTGVRRWVYDRSLVYDIARVFESFRAQRCTYQRDLSIVDDLLKWVADEIEEHDMTFDRERFMTTARYLHGRNPGPEDEGVT